MMYSPPARYYNQLARVMLDAISECELGQPDDLDGYPVHPIVEVGNTDSIQIQKQLVKYSSKAFCLVEASKNSIRLSFSFKQQYGDPLDQAILSKYLQFLQENTTLFQILRRRPIPPVTTTASQDDDEENLVFSLSFLIVNAHVRKFGSEVIVQTILDFVSRLDKECNQLKIRLNSRARVISNDFLGTF